MCYSSYNFKNRSDTTVNVHSYFTATQMCMLHIVHNLTQGTAPQIKNIFKGAFIVYCNVAALPIYQLLIYHSSTQHTAPQVHFLAVLQYRSRRRDGNTTTANLPQHSCSGLLAQLNFVAVVQFICLCRDGSSSTATHRNANALNYEWTFSLIMQCMLEYDCINFNRLNKFVYLCSSNMLHVLYCLKGAKM